MNQSFEIQLQVAQRALGEVVLPALGGAPGHVVEQLHLSMAALAFMQQRLPHARRYYRGTLLSYCDMADAVLALLADQDRADDGGLVALTGEGRAMLQSPTAEDADYCRHTGALRAAIAAVVAASRDAAHEAALDALILVRSGPILLEERVWCLPLGFELRPEDLPAPDWIIPT